MSMRLMTALVVGLAVAGCGGNPFGDDTFTEGGGESGGEGEETPGGIGGVGGSGGSGGGSTGGIPAELRGNLLSANFNQTAGTLTAVIDPLDASPVTVTFARNAALDRAGYQAFTYQESTSNRLFLALFRTSNNGAVSGGVTASGQFTEMVWGANYTANSAFSAPAAGGLANYSGRYIGTLNSGTAVPGPGAPFNPIQPNRVEGQVLLNADFTNNSVEGGIRNRSVVEGAVPLDDLFLTITEITSTGTFEGTVEFGDREEAGEYGGTFAGAGGSAVAGIIDVTPVPGDNDILEKGAFVLDRCVPGDPPPCP